jgi:hypothetical protein
MFKNYSDNDLWRAYEYQKEQRGPYDKLVQELGCELENRGYELHPLSKEDYLEWQAASCGMDYYSVAHPLY